MKTPDWLELEDWWQRFLKHCPVPSSSTSQRIVQEADHAPCDPLPYTVFKNPSLKPNSLKNSNSRDFGSFEHKLPILLGFVPSNKCYTFLHHNLVSVDWLSCSVSEWTQVQFGNTRNFLFLVNAFCRKTQLRPITAGHKNDCEWEQQFLFYSND